MVKPLHAEDPYELKAVEIDGGDPRIQARIMIEEMLDIGTEPQTLENMFNDKYYVGLHLMTEQLGTEVISEMISRTAEKSSVIRRTTTIITEQE